MIETDCKSTSYGDGKIRAQVYSTQDNIRVVFSNGDIEAAAWISENIARELIVLLTTVVDGTPELQGAANEANS